MARYQETTGYIIHTRNFKDSSLILEFFSSEFGLINLIAKGIKKNKQLKPHIQSFSLLKIQFFGRSQLKTISAINIINSNQFDDLKIKTAALYCNELLHYSLIENEKALSLFSFYETTLRELGNCKLNHLLRCFERELLEYNGFSLRKSQFNNSQEWLAVSSIDGLITTTKESEKICLVEDFNRFLENKSLDNLQKYRINKLMHNLIDLSLSYRKIYSRDLLKSLYTKTKNSEFPH